MFLKTLEYLNAALRKTGCEARLHLGGHDPTAADGIYFHRPAAAPRAGALPPAEVERLLQQHAAALDHGTLEAIRSYSAVNDRLVNKGACYIPLGRCAAVAALLGTEI